jgi:hypothetical protein
MVQSIIQSLDNEKSNQYKFFFHSIMPDASPELRLAGIKIIMSDFNDLLLELKENQYDDFLHKSINTIDTFGVGIAFACVLSMCVKFIEPALATELNDLFAFMLCSHLPSRLEPTEVLHKYKGLMSKYGLLEKHNKYYDNHIKDGKAKPDVIEKLVSTLDTTNLKLSTEEIKHLSDKPPMICPADKEPHRIERRCIPKCKDGKIRNANGRCVENKTVKKNVEPVSVKEIKQISVEPPLICPTDKEPHPIERRCIPKCKDGKIRNVNGRCVKNKTVKNNAATISVMVQLSFVILIIFLNTYI